MELLFTSIHLGSSVFSETTGDNNTAMGNGALFFDTDGFANKAVGAFAMEHNTDGFRNVATGVFALGSNTTGFRNTATPGPVSSSEHFHAHARDGRAAYRSNPLSSSPVLFSASDNR